MYYQNHLYLAVQLVYNALYYQNHCKSEIFRHCTIRILVNKNVYIMTILLETSTVLTCVLL